MAIELQEIIPACSLISIVAVTMSITVSNIKWWHNNADSVTSGQSSSYSDKLSSELSPEKITEPGTMPIRSLEVFYREGGPEIQASAVRLLKKLYISNPEAIGLVRSNLGDSDPTARRNAILVLNGLIIGEPLEFREKVCDSRTLEYLLYGMFESIESTDRASPLEKEYRKLALKLIHELDSSINMSNSFGFDIYESESQNTDPKFIYGLIEHGLFDFFIDYYRISLTDPDLPYLDEMTDPMSPEFLSFYSKVLNAALVENEKCKLNIIPWYELNGEVWRRGRLLALGSCNLGSLACDH